MPSVNAKTTHKHASFRRLLFHLVREGASENEHVGATSLQCEPSFSFGHEL